MHRGRVNVDRGTARGGLKAGKFADMYILSGNPPADEADAHRELVVLMIMVAGKTEWRPRVRGPLR